MAKEISRLDDAAALDGSELVEVSQLSTTVTITAATISALAADNSYNDSGNGFVAAGFAVTNRVKVTGFTGNVANNIFVGTITALTAGKMEIGGADGNVIADDAAGESVTITKWNSAKTTIADLAPQAYRVGFQMIDAATASEIILLHTFSHAATFADDFAGAFGVCGTNPAGTFTFDVQVNGASVGSVAISSGGVFTFTTTGGALAVAAGDVLKIAAPAGVDTAANVSFTLVGIVS